MRNLDLWEQRFDPIGLKRFVGKRTCDGFGRPFPVQLHPAVAGDGYNQPELGGQLLKNTGIPLCQRSCLVLGGVVRPVNSRHANRAVGSAQDELLPEVQLASDVGQRLRGTTNAIEQGNLLGRIEDEVGWPGFRLQLEINPQQLAADRQRGALTARHQVRANQPGGRSRDLINDWVMCDLLQEAALFKRLQTGDNTSR